MNPDLQAALQAARGQAGEIERQFGPPREPAPYQAPQQTEDRQQDALEEMELLERGLQVYLFRPLPDVTVAELAAVLAMVLPAVTVNSAGQTLEQRLGIAARHFALKR